MSLTHSLIWLISCASSSFTASFALLLLLASPSSAAPPAYDHVVIVIEENEKYEAVIGNPQAPYINSLASNGVNFTNMRAIVHPSQPNYLELFSGSNQAITGDAPVDTKFTTPNLGASLIAAGKTFAAYSDGLPANGDVTSDYVNEYTRRHCPWICWMPLGATLGPNQIPRSLHKTIAAFPSDFTQLPTVSFVIPNNIHNMHSGTIEAADQWLQSLLGAYAEWAKTHNSLLIITWDEDSFQQANRIPTIFYGANLQRFPNQGSWSLHNLLRTIEDMYGLPHSGRAALVPPIIGAFTGEPATITKRFSQSGSVEDTMVTSAQPDDSFAGSPTLNVVSSASAGTSQTLIKFDNIFGAASERIPANANIVSAKLIATTTIDPSYSAVNLHRMLAPWSGASTFNSLGNGVQTDGAEAVAASEFSAVPSWSGTAVVFDTTESLRQFASGTPNEGWLLASSAADRWTVYSSESTTFYPILEVTYAVADAIGFDQPEYVVTPGGVEARVLVHHYGTAGSPLAVNYSTNDVTATAGSDYNPAMGTLTWSAGDVSSKELVIPLIPDNLIEGNEVFRISLINTASSVELDTNATTSVRISERPFDVWRFSYFGAAANGPVGQPNADPDDDARTNFEEYTFCSNPVTVDSVSPLPTATVTQWVDGPRLSLFFRQNRLATELTYKVQISEDLATWTDGCIFAATGSVLETPTMRSWSPQYYPEYYLREITSSKPSSTGRLFMRVKVTDTP